MYHEVHLHAVKNLLKAHPSISTLYYSCLLFLDELGITHTCIMFQNDIFTGVLLFHTPAFMWDMLTSDKFSVLLKFLFSVDVDIE